MTAEHAHGIDTGGEVVGNAADYARHYRESERLATEALSGSFVGYGRENHLAAAQVHATLALAAATRAVIQGPVS